MRLVERGGWVGVREGRGAKTPTIIMYLNINGGGKIKSGFYGDSSGYNAYDKRTSQSRVEARNT